MMKPLLLRLQCIVCIFIFFPMPGDGVFAQSSPDISIHIPMEAEFYYLRTYQSLEGHKALAVGPGGNWAWSKGAPSSKSAEDAAMSECNKSLKASARQIATGRHCVLFDVDGTVTGQAPPIGIPFGTVLTGPDDTLGPGRIWKTSSDHRRGIMLMLHACNRVGMSEWWLAWINFYRSAGFWVFLPDSFAETRDEEACGDLGETEIDKQTRILKLRIAQTRRTLKILRENFPGEPIYVHGLSEGGVVAQALGEKVAGIIATGSTCGVGNSGAYWTAPDVPILVIAGTKDPFVPGSDDASEFISRCNETQGAGKLTAVSIRGMGNVAAIWWPEVNEAIATLLRTSSVKISRRSAVGIPHIPVDRIPGYREAKHNKALAADEEGNWHWVQAAETPFDAEEAALFGCDASFGKDSFSSQPRVYSCALIDVNGTRLVK